MRKLILAAVAALAAQGALAQDKPRIVAVNHALAAMAERLAGDAAEVTFPVPDGTDPSFWRPRIADISMIQGADLVLLNGAGFATWVDRVSLRRSKVVTTSAGLEGQFIVTESVTHSHGDDGEHSHEGTASYLWLDPSLAAQQAEAIAAALIARGLAPEANVSAALAEVKADLAALDSEARGALAGLEGETIIATHPRYQYLARAFGLTIEALEWEAGEAPTADQLADLQALAEKTGAGILIWEAEPPAGAFEATAALGLRNVTFPPLAQTPATGGFVETFQGALAALATAAP